MKNKVHEDTVKGKSAAERYIIPLLQNAGYDAQWRIGEDGIWTPKDLWEYAKWGGVNGRLRETDPAIGSGLLLEVFDTNIPDVKKLLQPWVRTTDKQLIPRFHTPSQFRDDSVFLTDKDKIIGAMELLAFFDIHFFALIQYSLRTPLFWLSAYHQVPFHWWKLTAQNRGGPRGRLEIKGKYQHVGQWKKEKDLKEILNQIFKK